MEDHFKRPNKLTGMPYESGFEDEDGRFFVKYLSKQGMTAITLKNGQEIKKPT
jgi:hypothetical protein